MLHNVIQILRINILQSSKNGRIDSKTFYYHHLKNDFKVPSTKTKITSQNMSKTRLID